MDIDVNIDLEWFQENRFWGATLFIGILLVAAFVWVWTSQSSTISGKEKDRKQLVKELKKWRSEAKSKDLVDVYEQEKEKLAGQMSDLVRFYLRADRDLEKWITQERNPGYKFEGAYKQKIKEIRDKALRSMEIKNRKGESEIEILGFSQAFDEQSKVPPKQRQRIQKQFWVIKRIAHDAMDSGVLSLNRIQFLQGTRRGSPVTVSGGEKDALTGNSTSGDELLYDYDEEDVGDRILAERIRVEVTCTVRDADVGTFLSKLHHWNREKEGLPALQNYIHGYRVKKTNSLGTDQFEVATKISPDNWKSWEPDGLEQLGNTQFQNREPYPVRVTIVLDYLDYNQKTLMDMLKVAEMEKEQRFRLFTENSPFLKSEIQKLN